MAHLTNCKYCGSNVINAEWHSECRAEFLEDLLAQIKSFNERNDAYLPKSVLAAFQREDFRTMDDIRKARVKVAEIETERAVRELAKKAHMAECEKKWDEKHPDERFA